MTLVRELETALRGLYDAMRNGANLERYMDDEIDELWDAAETVLGKFK